MGAIENFEKMLAEGNDSALLRFGLADAYVKRGEYTKAVPHLESAVQQDPRYSAAYKALGKVLSEAGRVDEAKSAFKKGISVAGDNGDVQAAKEMTVFLKRLEKEHE